MNRRERNPAATLPREDDTALTDGQDSPRNQTDDSTTMSDKSEVSTYLTDETRRVFDTAVEESDIRLNRSELLRWAINEGIESADDDALIQQLVPESTLAKRRVKRREERRKDEQYLNTRAAYWKQNVLTQLSKYFHPEAPARPAKVRVIMESYREAAHDFYSDAEALEADLCWLDAKLAEYEQAVRFSEAVPDEGMAGLAPEVEIGRDMFEIAAATDDLLGDIDDMNHMGDPADLAAKLGVEPDAVRQVLEHLTADEVTPEEAIRATAQADDIQSRKQAGENWDAQAIEQLNGADIESDDPALGSEYE